MNADFHNWDDETPSLSKLPVIKAWCCIYNSQQSWVPNRDMGTQEYALTLQWRHNERDGVSNHQPHDCLLNRVFKHRSKKTSNLRATGLCEGNSPVTGEFPHKWPATWKMLPFDDVIMPMIPWILFWCIVMASLIVPKPLHYIIMATWR